METERAYRLGVDIGGTFTDLGLVGPDGAERPPKRPLSNPALHKFLAMGNGVSSMVVNFSNYPAEVIEREYPLRIEEYGSMADSDGPGKFRGGLALVRRYRFLEESGTFQIRSDRSRFGAYGLAGGGSGRLSRNVLNSGPHERVLNLTASTVVVGT